MLMVDMAHFAGLVAAGIHPNPVEHADVVTSTTHKTLAGPRSGLVLSRAEHATAVDKAVFPGLQGGPLCHVVAAKAVCFKFAATEGFRAYQRQIVANAKALAATLMDGGVDLLTGGTDIHLIQLDLRKTQWSGKDAEERLHEVAITVNRNTVPFDERPPTIASGVRIGTPAVDDARLRRGRHARGGGDHPRRARPRGRPARAACSHPRAARGPAALLGVPAWPSGRLSSSSSSTIRWRSTSLR